MAPRFPIREVLLNLSRMNRILEIDETNWFVIIEPGVTYAQLQQTLMGKIIV